MGEINIYLTRPYYKHIRFIYQLQWHFYSNHYYPVLLFTDSPHWPCDFEKPGGTVDLLAATYSRWVSFTKPMLGLQKCHLWCHNCPGPITCKQNVTFLSNSRPPTTKIIHQYRMPNSTSNNRKVKDRVNITATNINIKCLLLTVSVSIITWENQIKNVAIISILSSPRPRLSPICSL